ncbi:hypothetical protein MNBD_ALPHA03-1284 [hydrothermal vent metagenome]|uniref:Uncharacterized protein n=1 Tax=hydrothermal vent metagenome TaxID=652676 RepID=A0A3B1APR9_9ZZZZ
MELLSKALDLLKQRWLVTLIVLLLTGGNISQVLYTGHNPEVLPEHTETCPEIPKVIIKEVPRETIQRICQEAVNLHENGRWH